MDNLVATCLVRGLGAEGDRVGRSYIHLHLLSDSTGETLIAASRAVTAQFPDVSSIEHVYPLVRTRQQIERAIRDIESAPGMVLFTLVDRELATRLTEACTEAGLPSLSVLQPITELFRAYLGPAVASPRPGAQHVLNADYFKRIDAMNFTIAHDDGQIGGGLEEADVLLLGVSRTSKTPTSIYLANRGIRTANIPIVPKVPLPPVVYTVKHPLIVGLVATPERIVQIRQHRLLSINASPETPYVNRISVAEEIAQSRRLFAEQGWATIDVTRRSIEETAATILDLLKAHRMKFIAQL